jgi:DNA replication protein DnaC
MRRAVRQLEADRQEREARFRARQERIFALQPRLRQIEGELHATMSRIITGALRRGTDPAAAIQALRDENLGLQAEKRRLLEKMGLPQDCLEEQPACPLCGDTGYRNGQVCRCLKQYYAREQTQELSRMLDLGSQSFDTFSLDWYSDRVEPGQRKSARRHMEEIVYNSCAEYAHQFGRKPRNLLLFGAPGLGKTHLSAAIAREVSEQGFSVVYDTAVHVFERFEGRKFGREEDEGDVERVLTCDLLILDDLGTEMTTAFVQSALYQIVNTRLMERRSTIISTNLSPEKLAQRYTPQLASRIEGEYQLLPFVGPDIRKQKKERQ